ncbi:DUF4175 domain-containing protein [Salmonella enterica subsp. enterica]|nr:DUF4175 domain-containing protein [Salmonella enterica subsp. enterica serovar Baguida]
MNILVVVIAWWLMVAAAWFHAGHGVNEVVTVWWRVAFLAPFIAVSVWAAWEACAALIARKI